MTLDSHSATPEESIGFQEVNRLVTRQEQLITILATTVGVMIVAAIAVLMGLA